MLCVLRWTRENSDVLMFSSVAQQSRELNDELLTRYRTPTSVDDVVQQRTLTVQMNHNNYVHRMHDLLRLEEFTQSKLIAELVTLVSCQFTHTISLYMSVHLIDSYPTNSASDLLSGFLMETLCAVCGWSQH